MSNITELNFRTNHLYKAVQKLSTYRFSIPAFFSYSSTPPMACKKNAYWPALAGGSPVSGNPFPSTGKAESRLNFELLRPTGLQQQIYSSSPDSSSLILTVLPIYYYIHVSYIINLKCSDQYSKVVHIT